MERDMDSPRLLAFVVASIVLVVAYLAVLALVGVVRWTARKVWGR
jgi:hypothetical protein